jgi:plastocyanin
VIVGGTSLVYTPNSITANVGDMVIFTFMSQNHTATQSAFTSPCVKLATGMDSGFMANVNNSMVPAPQMAMQVTVATPIWFYCKQKGHCGKGMTFSINPTANKTQAMFEAMAIAQNGTGSTAGIVASTTAGASAVSVATSAAVAVAPPAATSAAANNGLVSGSGSQQGSACSCSCFCGVGQFPAAVQGVAGFGGMPG